MLMVTLNVALLLTYCGMSSCVELEQKLIRMEQILKDFLNNGEAMDAYVDSKTVYLSKEDIDTLLKRQKEQLLIPRVSNWVTIESNIPPEKCTEIMVKYKDGIKAVALFDGDNRFYTLKDDIDISEEIISWHKLP